VTEDIAERVGVAIGSGMGGLPGIEKGHDQYLKGGPRRISPFFVPSNIINMIAGNLSIELGIKNDFRPKTEIQKHLKRIKEKLQEWLHSDGSIFLLSVLDDVEFENVFSWLEDAGLEMGMSVGAAFFTSDSVVSEYELFESLLQDFGRESFPNFFQTPAVGFGVMLWMLL